MTEVVISNNNINSSSNAEAPSRVEASEDEADPSATNNPIKMWLLKVKVEEENAQRPRTADPNDSPLPKFTRHVIRSNYMDKSIEAKKKVIRMLFVVVAEFFFCWAPLHLLNTWYLFSPEMVYNYVGSTGVSLVQLLAYASSCSNPITYCFMNNKFRQAFIKLFTNPSSCCCGKGKEELNPTVTVAGPIVSDLSGNDSTVYAGRPCRSEVLVLEKEERV